MEKHLCRGVIILLYFICGMPGMLATYCLETTMMVYKQHQRRRNVWTVVVVREKLRPNSDKVLQRLNQMLRIGNGPSTRHR